MRVRAERLQRLAVRLQQLAVRLAAQVSPKADRAQWAEATRSVSVSESELAEALAPARRSLATARTEAEPHRRRDVLDPATAVAPSAVV